jgi:hypothetical protein
VVVQAAAFALFIVVGSAEQVVAAALVATMFAVFAVAGYLATGTAGQRRPG